MGILEDFDKTLKQMKDSVFEGLKDSINKNKNVLEHQVTDQQWNKGKDANSISIVPEYTRFTKVLKRAKGQPTDRVTLKDSGDLYRSVEIRANNTEMSINTNISYFPKLLLQYKNNELLGIQDEAMMKFLEDFAFPEIEKNFKQILG